MTSLPEELFSQLWRLMGENKSWSAFIRTVMSQCGLTEKLDVMTVDYLVREAYDLKQTNVQFPDSPGGLAQVLHERMSHTHA